ncbi:S8 family serine peptidase [Streptomyces sp. NBC_00212]|uniref:S8 family serine peptidase n=1 Tax=Streptomyces sp. NBC_00212 TaxID=2975684 RepID=UPI002F917209
MAVSLAGLFAAICPADAAPARSSPLAWPLSALHADAAWRTSTGAGVIVALVDSGVQADADLTGPRLQAVDFTGSQTPQTDDDQVLSHGTMMAALINGARGLPGLAPQSILLPLKAITPGPRASATGDAQAIRYAADHGAKVLNLSFGLPSSLDAWQEAVQYAIDKDVVVVAAAGNSGTHQSPLNFPAAYPGVLAVSATGPDGHLWKGSTWGPGLGIAAPGADMPLYSRGCSRTGTSFTICNGDGGTSAATAYTSAAAALLRSAHPDWNAPRVIARLRTTARPPHHDPDRYGAGTLAPDLALTNPSSGPTG